MRLIQIIFLCLLSVSIQAQEIPTNDDSGNAEYKNGDQIAGLSKQQLYDRGKAWINKFYVNPNGVMKKQDAEGGEIVGRARYKLSRVEDKGRVNPNAGYVSYQITLQFKDGKYRYVIDGIRWEKPSYYDVSQWADTTQNNYSKPEYTSYIEQTIKYFDDLTESLESYMKVGEAVKTDDW